MVFIQFNSIQFNSIQFNSIDLNKTKQNNRTEQNNILYFNTYTCSDDQIDPHICCKICNALIFLLPGYHISNIVWSVLVDQNDGMIYHSHRCYCCCCYRHCYYYYYYYLYVIADLTDQFSLPYSQSTWKRLQSHRKL